MSNRNSIVANRYELLGQLGVGGMGAVFRANDRLTGDQVALKRVQLNTALHSESQTTDPRLTLANEFRTLATLHHPHVINVLDYGFDADDRVFFTMTLVEGSESIVRASRDLPVQDRIALVVQILQALTYVHRRGVLHRDLKPANVLVRDGHVYVVDFGLATGEEDGVESEFVAGTIAYMAPEMFTRQSVSVASDLYAVGVITYEILLGDHPFQQETVNELIMHIVTGEIDFGALDIDLKLLEVVKRLLATKPEDRYPDAPTAIRALCEAVDLLLPAETEAIRDSYLTAARFIGREEPMARMLAAQKRMTTEQSGSGWLIGGESGVGKSRLVDEVAIQAMVDRVLVLRGQAITERGAPYQIYREALRRLALFVPFSDDEAALLRQIVPDIDTLLDREIPPTPDVAPADAQKRLSLIVEDAFRRATEHRPVLLILEDLQWAATQADLTLIRNLMAMVHSLPLMITATYRDDEARDLPEELPDAQKITLKRLNIKEISDLSYSMLGTSGRRKAVIDLLHKETEGNLFFLVEVVRALAEDAGGLNEIGQVTLPEQIFAGGVQRVVEYRLNRVPEWARVPLDSAAVIGRQINLTLLHALDPDLDLNAWLTDCTNAGVLTNDGGDYQFAHDKLREGVLERMIPGFRKQHHQRVAQVIEQVYADSLDEYAVILAGHYAAAGNDTGEARYTLIAAGQAYAANNYREATRLYQRALELDAHTLTDQPDRTLASIKLGLGKASYGLSDYDTARGWCHETITLLDPDEGGTVDDRQMLADAINCLGECDFRQSRWETASEHTQKALVIRRELGLSRDIGYSLMNLGVIAAQTGHLDEARQHFEECYRIMETAGEPIALARALNNLGIVYDLSGEPAKARETYTRSLSIRRDINDRQGIGYSLLNIAALDEMNKDYDRAESALLEAKTLLEQVGDRLAYAAVLSSLAQVTRKQGDYSAAEAYEKEALVVRRMIGAKGAEAISLNGLAIIALDRNELQDAWGFAQQSLRIAHEIDQASSMIFALQTLARVYFERGNSAKAVTIIQVLMNAPEANALDLENLREHLDEFRQTMTDTAFNAAIQTSDGVTLRALAAEMLD